jgi:hypothetical protein
MTKRRSLSKPPYFDPRPRGPGDRGYEWYAPNYLGREIRTRRGLDALDRLTSIHESGHALGHIYFNQRFIKMWMSYAETGRGNIRLPSFDPEIVSRQWRENDAIASLMGRAAEHYYAPRSHWRLAAGYEGRVHGKVRVTPNSDLDNFWYQIDALGESEAFAGELFERADALVRTLWPEIRYIAMMLLARKTLTELQVYKLLKYPMPARMRLHY